VSATQDSTTKEINYFQYNHKDGIKMGNFFWL